MAPTAPHCTGEKSQRGGFKAARSILATPPSYQIPSGEGLPLSSFSDPILLSSLSLPTPSPTFPVLVSLRARNRCSPGDQARESQISGPSQQDHKPRAVSGILRDSTQRSQAAPNGGRLAQHHLVPLESHTPHTA